MGHERERRAIITLIEGGGYHRAMRTHFHNERDHIRERLPTQHLYLLRARVTNGTPSLETILMKRHNTYADGVLTDRKFCLL